MDDATPIQPMKASGLGYGAKLSLAIMSVVTLVSVVILVLTRDRVESAYLEQAERLADSQSEFFGRLQSTRLQEIRRRMNDYKDGAEGVRFRAALNALQEPSDPAEKSEDQVLQVYEVVEEGLKSMRGGDAEAGAAMEGGALFYRVLDSKGMVLEPPPAVDAGLKSTAEARKGVMEVLGSIRQVLTNAAPQEIGYAVVTDSHGKKVLVELVSTRVLDTFNETTIYLGTLVVGFPVPSSESKTGGGSSAIWAGEDFHPGNVAPWNEAGLRDRLKPEFSGDRASGNVRIPIQGVDHRFSFRRLSTPVGMPSAFLVASFSMAEAMAAQASLSSRILAVAGFGLLAGLMLSLVIAHGLTVPVRRLAAATRDILEGRFDIRLPVRSSDEVGQLTASFNEMAEGLALKERYHNVLNQVADKQVAAELMSGRVTLGGETREVSVLFCDIRGFTALTENMPPSEVIAMLNEHMTALTRVVHAHHGVVDKFVGDLIMAIFGAPRSYGKDAELAARCALEMISQREALNAVSKYKIRMGIGLATGPVVAGCMGSSDRLNYTVLGERVNLASRLCSKAGAMEVVIDKTTRESLAESARVVAVEPLTLKGFAQQVPAFKLESIQSKKT